MRIFNSSASTFFFLIVSLTLTGQAYPQNSSVTTLLQQGMDLYGKGKWREAVLELRRAQGLAQTNAQRTEALDWISLAEIGAGEYEAAVRDIEKLENTAGPGALKQELAYNKGRCYYYLGRYEEAMVLLKNYADGVTNEKKYAAYFWIGESLFSLGRLDQARDIFTLIIQDAPQSAKYEAATYRIALINQKKVEAE
ncbi:tetratricopeptide repeat protein, partial [Breznakiellaceae bacterium SP9]